MIVSRHQKPHFAPLTGVVMPRLVQLTVTDLIVTTLTKDSPRTLTILCQFGFETRASQDGPNFHLSQATTPGDADGRDFPYNGIRNMLRPHSSHAHSWIIPKRA